MYLYKSSLDLATNATPADHNLSLCFAKDDDVLADALAVIHESYVNIIPVMNMSRRSKYLPIFSGTDRGKGSIKQVKWIELNHVIFFIVVSTNGLQIYDAEISNMIYHHCVRETGDEKSYAKGICVVRNLLCIGSHYGTIWVFQQHEKNVNEFKVVTRVFAHDDPVNLMESMGSYMVSSSMNTIYMWNYNNKEFNIVRKFTVIGMADAHATVIIFKFGFIIIAYSTGEFCIFDMNDDQICMRNIAHKLAITGMDFSPRFLIVTVSCDCYIKIWKYEQTNNNVALLETMLNEEGPLYGIGFLNYSCTEFCTVTGNNTKIKIYIDWENEVAEDIPRD